MRSITMFSVGNANCCLVDVDGTFIVVDLQDTEDKSAYEMISPMLPLRNGKRYLDVLCITHGHEDHCKGYGEFQTQMDKGNLVIGSIWHPNYDRTKVEEKGDLPADYLSLHKEIMHRRKDGNKRYGDYEIPLTAWDTEAEAFKGIALPEGVRLRVLSPYIKDEGDTGWDVNDISLVFRLTISGLSTLFVGDSTSAIWCERVIPYTLKKDDKKDWARSDILVVSHHGSWGFFGNSRDEVRDADPAPDNYAALDYIEPGYLAISAASRFPTGGDSTGDLPPHYAAWKWYHKWFRDHRDVKESDKHPSQFKYTSDGHIRLELDGGTWKWVNDWTPDDGGSGSTEGAGSRGGFKYRGGDTRRDGDHYASR